MRALPAAASPSGVLSCGGAVGVSLLLHSLRTEIEKAVHKLASKTSDRVDTASMGSFPASDPPALAQIGPRPTHAE